MGKKKFALLGVCVMLCLLIMSAMSGSLFGYSNAWFTSSAQADASITADFLTLEDIVEDTLPESYTWTFTKGKPFTIGSIRAKIVPVTVEYKIEDGTGTLQTLIQQIKPDSPFDLKQNKSEDIKLHPQNNHGVAPGTYTGQLVFTFTYGVETFTKTVLVTIVIP